MEPHHQIQAATIYLMRNMVSHLWPMVRIPARVVNQFGGQRLTEVETTVQVKQLCVRHHRKTVGRHVTNWEDISRSFRPTCLRTADLALLNSPLLQPT